MLNDLTLGALGYQITVFPMIVCSITEPLVHMMLQVPGQRNCVSMPWQSPSPTLLWTSGALLLALPRSVEHMVA